MSKPDEALADFRSRTDHNTLHHTISHTPPGAADSVTVRVVYHKRGQQLLAEVLGASVNLDRPVRLETVTIDKPWGREVWYTGMEARGESRVLTDSGETLPLSLYLSLAPRLLARNRSVLLLKVLDPSPEEIVGDLYFEVHEDKEEVYVVTHIDRGAWPDGSGAIRFGMNQAQVASLGDRAFRAAYTEALRNYETLRRQIDGGGEAVAVDVERAARLAMEAFTATRKLAVGEVVKVPTWLPHSLQHGVRVVEFQTPTYERRILSFAQRVLTQDHWDYEYAVPRMTITAPEPAASEFVAPGIERIARFEDFNVWRMTRVAASTALPAHIAYAVCMAIGGAAQVGGLNLAPEEACFIPASAIHTTTISGDEHAQILLAAPDL